MRRSQWSMVLVVGLVLVASSFVARWIAAPQGAGPSLAKLVPPRAGAATLASLAAPLGAFARSLSASATEATRTALSSAAWEDARAALATLATSTDLALPLAALLGTLLVASASFALGTRRSRRRRLPERRVLSLAGRGEAAGAIAARTALPRDGVRLLLRPRAADARNGRA